MILMILNLVSDTVLWKRLYTVRKLRSSRETGTCRKSWLIVMGSHVSGKRLGGLVVVGERGCDVERSMDEEMEEEQGRGDEERPPKVCRRGVSITEDMNMGRFLI